MGECRLCRQQETLKESHLFPKFVFRWLTKTGGTYFRSTSEPNVRRQDGPKEHLLCGDCEQRFSTHEAWFANEVFKPYCDEGQHRFPYEGSFFYFGLSVLWRILDHGLRQGLHERIAPFKPQLEAADAEWRDFLLTRSLPLKFNDLHVFVTDIGFGNGEQPVEGLNVFMARAVDGEIIGSQSRCVVYAKMARFIFFGAVTPVELKPEDNTKIDATRGVLTIPQTLSDGWLGEFLVDRARVMNEKVRTALSARQRSKVNDYVRGNPHVLTSDLGRAMAADRTAKVVPFITGKVGRNEPCPCGSGRKFKRCHLGSS